MLVLTRQYNEKVILKDFETGDHIEVRLLDWGRNAVKLGFTADSRFEIIRGELEESWSPRDAA